MAAIDDALTELKDEFDLLGDWEERYRYVIEMGKDLAPLSAASRRISSLESYEGRGDSRSAVGADLVRVGSDSGCELCVEAGDCADHDHCWRLEMARACCDVAEGSCRRSLLGRRALLDHCGRCVGISSGGVESCGDRR